MHWQRLPPNQNRHLDRIGDRRPPRDEPKCLRGRRSAQTIFWRRPVGDGPAMLAPAVQPLVATRLRLVDRACHFAPEAAPSAQGGETGVLRQLDRGTWAALPPRGPVPPPHPIH